MGHFSLKDSGVREEQGTGAVRDTQVGKGRFDLLPSEPLYRIARIFEEGARKYADRNWEKGIPVSRCLSSAMRHLLQYQGGFEWGPAGLSESLVEDHLAQSATNLIFAMEMERAVRIGRLDSSTILDLPWQIAARKEILDDSTEGCSRASNR